MLLLKTTSNIVIMQRPSHIIVIGTSAGGLKALSGLVAQLDPSYDAAFFIVMHLSPATNSDFLLFRLQPFTSLKCTVAGHGMPVERGHIYIAPPRQHLLVDENQVLLGMGPEENRWKPSVDVLFRAAAASWSNRVTGIILTGMLDDGTAGMVAIKKSGGTCIVQDPAEAEYPGMATAVLNAMDVDACLPVADMGAHLKKITSVVKEAIAAPQEVKTEANIAMATQIDYEAVKQLGEQSIYACPDCGGGLWEIDETPSFTRYRCHVGHAYTEEELSLRQNDALESTLWVALRIMEERRNLLVKMGKKNKDKGYGSWTENYTEKATELEAHIAKLKEVLYATRE